MYANTSRYFVCFQLESFFLSHKVGTSPLPHAQTLSLTVVFDLRLLVVLAAPYPAKLRGDHALSQALAGPAVLIEACVWIVS